MYPNRRIARPAAAHGGTMLLVVGIGTWGAAMRHRNQSPWWRLWPPFAVAAILAWASSGPAPIGASWLPTALRWAAGAFVVIGLVVAWRADTAQESHDAGNPPD